MRCSVAARTLASAFALFAAALGAQSTPVPELFEQVCAECHSGWDKEADFDIGSLFAEPATPDARQRLIERLQLAADRVRSGTMPPADQVEPLTQQERRELTQHLVERVPVEPGARVATMRRLTRRQYEHTVEALLGIVWRANGLLPDDAPAHGFESIGDVQNVSPLLFEKYLDAASQVATAVLDDDGACARVFGDDLPVADWLPGLLSRAFRRPVGDDEVADFAADAVLLQRSGASTRDVRHAVLRSVLASPSFLFRAELGDANDPARLSPHELAVRLSYLLTSRPPDDELRARADDGTLRERDVLVAQALRLARLRDGRGLADDFATQWLGLREVLDVTPDFRRFPAIWNKSLRPSLRDEMVHAFAYVVREDRSVLELIDADYAFVDRTTAKHYGLPEPDGGGFHKVGLPDRRRGGVIGAGAMLMATSYPLRTSPVKRGQWILARLLDAPPPPPPPEAGELPKDDKNDEGLTLRQQLERHRASPSCASCHLEMDALGYALEHYDPLGRWRDEVHGAPVDAVAELPDGTRLDGPVALKDALLRRGDDFVRAFAKKLLVLGVGRDMTLRDEPELWRIVAATRADGDRFAALLEAVVTSPLFTMRDPDHNP